MNRYTDVDLQNKRLPPVGGYWNEDVVPLEVALRPIESLFNDLSRSIKMAKKKCTFPSEHGLTRDESATVYLYTMEGGQNSFYRILNEALRSDNRPALKPWFPFLKLFDVALNKLPIVKGSVWRGVPGDVSGQLTKNQVLTWWSISSCSQSVDIIQGFLGSSNSSTIFMIEAVSARDISSYSYYPNENEVVLGLGTELRVKADMLKHAGGLNIVHLVQLNDDDDDEELTKAVDKMNLKSEVSVAGAVGTKSSTVASSSVSSASKIKDESNYAPIQHMQAEQELFLGGTLLSDKQHELKLNEFYGNPKQRWELIYKAAKHGFAPADFHRHCDGQGPTMTVIKSQVGNYLFGAFTKLLWSHKRGFSQDTSAFLFTLTNSHKLSPTKFDIIKANSDNAVYHPGAGYLGELYDFYLFGFGGNGLNWRNFYDEYDGAFGTRRGDLFVASNCNKNSYSSTRFPCSYNDTCGFGDRTFTGTATFTVSDIEVYILK